MGVYTLRGTSTDGRARRFRRWRGRALLVLLLLGWLVLLVGELQRDDLVHEVGNLCMHL